MADCGGANVGTAIKIFEDCLTNGYKDEKLASEKFITMSKLAMALMDIKKKEDALGNARAALAGLEGTLGDKDAETRKVAFLTMKILADLGNDAESIDLEEKYGFENGTAVSKYVSIRRASEAMRKRGRSVTLSFLFCSCSAVCCSVLRCAALFCGVLFCSALLRPALCLPLTPYTHHSPWHASLGMEGAASCSDVDGEEGGRAEKGGRCPR